MRNVTTVSHVKPSRVKSRKLKSKSRCTRPYRGHRTTPAQTDGKFSLSLRAKNTLELSNLADLPVHPPSFQRTSHQHSLHLHPSQKKTKQTSTSSAPPLLLPQHFEQCMVAGFGSATRKREDMFCGFESGRGVLDFYPTRCREVKSRKHLKEKARNVFTASHSSTRKRERGTKTSQGKTHGEQEESTLQRTS